MQFDLIAWDDADDDDGNVRHVADHGVTTGEVEEVLDGSGAQNHLSRSSGRPIIIGFTSTGRRLIVVFDIEYQDGFTIVHPVTAYDV